MRIEEFLDEDTKAALREFRESVKSEAKLAYNHFSIDTEGRSKPSAGIQGDMSVPVDVPSKEQIPVEISADVPYPQP